MDYLLKPVEPDRLRRALERARRRGREIGAARAVERLVTRLQPAEPVPLAARRGDTVYFFDPRRITSLHAEDNYVAFVIGDKKYLLDASLRDLEQRLVDLDYLRVHRGALVNLRRVVGLRTEGGGASVVLADGRTIAVSRRRLAAVRSRPPFVYPLMTSIASTMRRR